MTARPLARAASVTAFTYSPFQLSLTVTKTGGTGLFFNAAIAAAASEGSSMALGPSRRPPAGFTPSTRDLGPPTRPAEENIRGPTILRELIPLRRAFAEILLPPMA